MAELLLWERTETQNVNITFQEVYSSILQSLLQLPTRERTATNRSLKLLLYLLLSA